MRFIGLAGLLVLGGCTAVVDQGSLFPEMALSGQPPALVPPPGYTLDERMLDLPGLGQVHAVRMTRPGSVGTLLYSGGNGSFVRTSGERFARLAAMTGADIVAYDYPGRGGTTVPARVDALIAMGPALRAAFGAAGWVKPGPVWAYGFSLGGAPASNIAAAGGVTGLVLEATAADIPAVGRNMVPGMLRPFVRIEVADDLKRYDYQGYVVRARVPVLLVVGRDDRTVDAKTVTRFSETLKAAGVDATLVTVPGGHGDAIDGDAGVTAVRGFLARTGGGVS
ncbi:alpha/beta fold hydrolase [Sphingomonas arantia]|uniref:Alpha/beta fold hydrolase n=1 Tax=Sphingomonas arantia TaxID=1460676 RepID=A0ABW4TXF5_9SPHN